MTSTDELLAKLIERLDIEQKTYLLELFSDEEVVNVGSALQHSQTLPSNTLYLIISHRNLTKPVSLSPDRKIQYRCRNFILFFQNKEVLRFRVYEAYFKKNNKMVPYGLLSYEHSSQASKCKGKRVLMNQGQQTCYNFGLNSRGFEHLIACISDLLGPKFDVKSLYFFYSRFTNATLTNSARQANCLIAQKTLIKNQVKSLNPDLNQRLEHLQNW